VTARGESLADARAAAYAACELVKFPDMRYRRDIAAQEAGVAG
jgi:phosphoribosylamine-glycine ligase